MCNIYYSQCKLLLTFAIRKFESLMVNMLHIIHVHSGQVLRYYYYCNNSNNKHALHDDISSNYYIIIIIILIIFKQKQ